MAEKIDIAELDFDTSKLTQNLLNTRVQIDQLRGDLTGLRKETRENSKTTQELTEKQKDLEKQGKQNTKEYEDNSKALDKSTKDLNNNTAAVIKKESELRNLSKEQRELNKIIDLTSKSEKDNAAVMASATEVLKANWQNQQEAGEANRAMYAIKKQLNPQIAEEAALMKQLSERINESDEYQKQFNTTNEERVKGIGKYKEQILQAIGATKGFGNASKGAIPGLSGLTAGAQSFSAVPLFTIVSLLITGFKFLFDKLKSTQGGMDAITKVTRPLSAIMDALTGILQEVGTWLMKAFTEPKKIIEEVYNYVKDKVVKQFQAYGKILMGIATLDWSQLKEGFSDIAENVSSVVNDLTDAAGKIKDRFDDAYNSGKRIDELQKEIEQRENAMILLQQQTTSELRIQEEIARDQSRTQAERQKAVQEQNRLAEVLTRSEQKILDLKIEQLSIQQSLNDTSREDEAEMNKLIAERGAAEDRLANTKKKNLGVEKQLRDEANRTAAAAAKARVQEALELQKVELETFILLNQKNKENVQQEIDFANEVSIKRQEILDAELKNKSLSRAAYDLASLQNVTELAEKEAEITVFYATQMLNEEILLLEQKRAEGNRLTTESVIDLNAEINRISEEQRLVEKQRLDAGLIDRHEFNEAIKTLEQEKNLQINEINDEFKLQNDEDENLRRMLENEAILLNLEDRFEMERELETQRFEEKQIELDNQFANGLISEANYNKASENLNKSHSKAMQVIDAAVYQNKVKLASEAFGQLATLAGEQSAVGKAFAIAQATIDTYSSAVSAFNSLSGIPIVGPVLGGIAAAAAVAMGLQNVRKIVSTNPQQKYTGGYTGGGGMFNKVGNVHAGEVVFSQRDVSALGGPNAVESMRPTSDVFGSMPTGVSQDRNEDERWEMIANILGEKVEKGSEKGTSGGMVEAGENEFVRLKSTF